MTPLVRLASLKTHRLEAAQARLAGATNALRSGETATKTAESDLVTAREAYWSGRAESLERLRAAPADVTALVRFSLRRAIADDVVGAAAKNVALARKEQERLAQTVSIRREEYAAAYRKNEKFTALLARVKR